MRLFLCLAYLFCGFIFNRTNGLGDGCKVLNWNYTQLSDLNYNDAISYVQSHTSPESISCFDRAGSYFHYDFEYPDSSIVDEVSYFRL